MTIRVNDIWTKTNDLKSDLEFVKHFDAHNSVEEFFQSGFIDFTTRIYSRDFYPITGDPRSSTCLEIGYGAGRLLNAASRFFNEVVGVDIHESRPRAEKFLLKNGCENFKLLQRAEIDTIPDKSIKFAFSFIVFQHFTRWSEVEFYLQLLDRVVSDDGAGILYFGYNNRKSDKPYVESGDFFPEARGYSLVVTPQFAIDEINKKFKVFEAGRGFKYPWTTDGHRSAQFYVKFKRG
jgi:hypothetical protein